MTGDSPGMLLVAILQAVGYQEEEVKWFIVDALREQGVPALWVQFDDSAPRQGTTIPPPCPWHSMEGGIQVTFATDSVAREVYQQQETD
jgi:hypothetical protein